MRPIQFKGQTNVLAKPKDMTDEECNALPVQMTKNGEHPCMESVWELTEEDLAVIKISKCVRLRVIGTMHPPIYMEVERIEHDAVEFQETIKD
jgi:hypothetical protein